MVSYILTCQRCVGAKLTDVIWPKTGSPYTLAQAQSHLSDGPLGSRITFVNTDPIRHLSTLTPRKGSDESGDQFSYDYAVFALCLWYFSTSSEIKETLEAVSRHARVVCIAEWSMAPSRAFPGESYPHLLAACAQAALAARLPIGTSDANIRTLATPPMLKRLLSEIGKGKSAATQEGLFTPDEKTLDGSWEVQGVLSKHWEQQVDVIKSADDAQDARDKELLLGFRDAVKAALPNAPKATGVRCMDIWWAIIGDMNA
jgi:hypothetical protein